MIRLPKAGFYRRLCRIRNFVGQHAAQMIGASDKHAAEPADRPVHMGEVHATLFQHMGLDPNTTTISDLTGRPQYLVDGWKPLPELI